MSDPTANAGAPSRQLPPIEISLHQLQGVTISHGMIERELNTMRNEASGLRAALKDLDFRIAVYEAANLSNAGNIAGRIREVSSTFESMQSTIRDLNRLRSDYEGTINNQHERIEVLEAHVKYIEALNVTLGEQVADMLVPGEERSPQPTSMPSPPPAPGDDGEFPRPTPLTTDSPELPL